MRKLHIVFLLLAAFMVNLNAADIRFQARRPAYIDVPAHIRNIAVIDRSVQTEAYRNKVEEGLTIELKGEDQIASQYAISGLIEMLQNSGRFEVVRTELIVKKQSRANEFPAPFSWEEINKYCSDFKVDAIISLELFDSDYIIATNMAFVKIGFRLYDPRQQLIIDQDQYRHEMIFDGHVNDLLGAVIRVAEKTKAIRQVSYDAGYSYGQRIAPSWFTVVRQYYRKGKHNQDLKAGARMMEVNDWDAAIGHLNSAVESGKRKAQGRAAHNLAVVYEIKGDLEEAKKWAQAAWGKYNNKDSRNYAYILGERIKEQSIVNYQDGK